MTRQKYIHGDSETKKKSRIIFSLNFLFENQMITSEKRKNKRKLFEFSLLLQRLRSCGIPAAKRSPGVTTLLLIV